MASWSGREDAGILIKIQIPSQLTKQFICITMILLVAPCYRRPTQVNPWWSKQLTTNNKSLAAEQGQNKQQLNKNRAKVVNEEVIALYLPKDKSVTTLSVVIIVTIHKCSSIRLTVQHNTCHFGLQWPCSSDCGRRGSCGQKGGA